MPNFQTKIAQWRVKTHWETAHWNVEKMWKNDVLIHLKKMGCCSPKSSRIWPLGDQVAAPFAAAAETEDGVEEPHGNLPQHSGEFGTPLMIREVNYKSSRPKIDRKARNLETHQVSQKITQVTSIGSTIWHLFLGAGYKWYSNIQLVFSQPSPSDPCHPGAPRRVRFDQFIFILTSWSKKLPP